MIISIKNLTLPSTSETSLDLPKNSHSNQVRQLILPRMTLFIATPVDRRVPSKEYRHLFIFFLLCFGSSCLIFTLKGSFRFSLSVNCSYCVDFAEFSEIFWQIALETNCSRGIWLQLREVLCSLCFPCSWFRFCFVWDGLLALKRVSFNLNVWFHSCRLIRLERSVYLCYLTEKKRC